MKDLYLNNSQFKVELERCLHCKTKPCEKACPLHCSPHDFIVQASQGNIQAAADGLRLKNPLAHCCGLLCPDHFCQKACLRAKIDTPVDIPAVQAVIMKQASDSKIDLAPLIGQKVAVVGAGPAGLAAAWQLAKDGFEVVLFDQEESVGGAMEMIPAFRLPRDVLESDWRFILQTKRISFVSGKIIDDFQTLFHQGFCGVIAAVGRQKNIDLGVEGEEHVVSYMDYLKAPQNYVTQGRVAIVGGGNVAVDCALTAQRQGASEVTLFIRRKIYNMKVTAKEFQSLLSHQINLTTTTRVCKVEKENSCLTVYTCSTRETENGYQDIEDSTVRREGFALVIKAIGSSVENAPFEHPHLIFAGDCVNGASTVVEAAASGIQAAKDLYQKLQGEKR